MIPNLQRVHPDRYTAALWQLREIYEVWQADRNSWREADTICLSVIPILHLLNFPTRSIRQTVQQIRGDNGPNMRPDFAIESYGYEFGIIEAKKASTDLNARQGYKNFHSPIDQALSYFDRRQYRFAIATNGFEWIVFRRASGEIEQNLACRYEAIRAELKDTIRYDLVVLLDEFLYNFDYHHLMRGGWPDCDNSYQKRVQFQRKNGTVNVLMHDFSWDDTYPRSNLPQF